MVFHKGGEVYQLCLCCCSEYQRSEEDLLCGILIGWSMTFMGAWRTSVTFILNRTDFLKKSANIRHISIFNYLFWYLLLYHYSFVWLQSTPQDPSSVSPPPPSLPPPHPPPPRISPVRCCCCSLRVLGAAHRSHGGLSQRDEEDLLGAGDQTAGPVRLQSSQDLRQRPVAAVEILRLCR